jgi:DNA repair protein RadC
MSQRELSSIILRSSAEGARDLQSADMLLQRFGSLHGLALADAISLLMLSLEQEHSCSTRAIA